MALIPNPTGQDWLVARAIFEALTDDRDDMRPWNEQPDHRRCRYLRAAIAAADILDRSGGATVIAFRSTERTA